MEEEGGGRVYTYRYIVTARMTCIKLGSGESHFNVSLIVRDKVTRRCPQSTTFEEKGEPKRSGVHGWFPFEGGQVVNCWDILSTLTLSSLGSSILCENF